MLRQRVRDRESDRYITARSAERDKLLEKYSLLDNKGKSLNNFSRRWSKHNKH
jgi:hypothetical protein